MSPVRTRRVATSCAIVAIGHFCGVEAGPERLISRPDRGYDLAAVPNAALGFESGYVYYEAEQHRLEGELRLRDSIAVPTAENRLSAPTAFACRQQAKFWGLRAEMSLAPPMWRDRGRRAEAHAPCRRQSRVGQ
jgi:hypothetical protein